MPSHALKHKVVVITGASSGIGRALSLELADKHARLVLAARQEESLEALAEECEAHGAQTLVVATDVSNSGEVDALARQAVQRFGRIDAWVNDAGVHVLGSLEETPLEAFHRVMDVNYFGVVHGTLAAVRQFRAQAGGGPPEGVILNVASQLENEDAAYVSAYAASKQAVRSFTAAVRQELRGSGISVCTLMPGAVDTPLFLHSANYTGVAVRSAKRADSPEALARGLLHVLEHPRGEWSLGARPLPKALRRLAPRANERGHFLDEPQAKTPGNLYHPAPPGNLGTTRGTGEKTRSRWSRVGLALTVGVGLLSVSRRLLRS